MVLLLLLLFFKIKLIKMRVKFTDLQGADHLEKVRLSELSL